MLFSGLKSVAGTQYLLATGACLFYRTCTKHVFVYATVLLLCVARCAAQEVDDIADSISYTSMHFTDENGLPQNSIKFIAPDKDGFVWLGTENGLARFDGREFRTFQEEDVPATSGRISLMMPDFGRNELFALTDKKEFMLIRNGAPKVLPDYEKELQEALPFPDTSFGFKQLLGLPAVYATWLTFAEYFIPLGQKEYFLISKDSVAQYSHHQLQAVAAFPHTSPLNFFSIDRQLYYWNGKKQFSILQQNAVKPVIVKGDLLLNPSFTHGNGKASLYWNVSGKNVFLFVNKNLYLISRSQGNELTTQLIVQNFDFEGFNITSLYYDAAHARLFMGSSNRGLLLLTRKRFRTLTSGIKGDKANYYAQAIYKGNSIVTGNGNVIDPGQPPLHLETIAKYSDNYTMLKDKEGRFWAKAGTELTLISGNGRQVLNTWRFPNRLNQLYQDSKATIWIGTMNQLFRMDAVNARLTPVPVAQTQGMDISYLHEETDSLFWIGTGSGLYRLHIPAGKTDTIAAFRTSYIRSLYIPVPNEVWITAYGEGLFLYRNEQVVHFPMDNNKYLGSAHCIVEDDKGYFWITTNKGLFQVARKDLLAYANGQQQQVFYLHYGKESGFNTNEFNGGCEPCGIKMPDGNISFPSLNGLVWVKPGLPADVPGNRLFVDNIEINGDAIPVKDTIRLVRDFGQLKLNVATAYFGDASNIILEYALLRSQNQSPVWLRTGRSITLSALPADTYRLLIRKQSGFGDAWDLISMVIVVPPAFYETTWFFVLLTLLLIGGIWLYTRLRLRFIKQKNSLLEMQVAQRTGELQATLQELLISEKKLRKQTNIQERLIGAITHDIKSPLKYITMIARKTYEDVLGHSHQDKVLHSTRTLYEAGHRVYHLADNLLQYVKLQSRHENIEQENVLLYELVEEKSQIFRDIAAARSTVIINEILRDLQLTTNRALLGVIIHNLIDNATKVTYNGSIIVSCMEEPEYWRILVKDTGKGMPESMLEWCNSNVVTDKPTAGGAAVPNGLGLVNTKELLLFMDGRLQAELNKPAGTVITVLLKKIAPVEQEA